MFHLPYGVQSTSNVGCCGIDGCTSALIGSSRASPNRLCYLVTGDLAFFYDMNVLGNRHIDNNVRLMVVNNGVGVEFKFYHHQSDFLDVDKYIGAAGHFGNKSPLLVKHYAEDLGFEYLTASNKDEFLANLDRFTESNLTDKPMIFEVFTNHEDESEALRLMCNIVVDPIDTKTLINYINSNFKNLDFQNIIETSFNDSLKNIHNSLILNKTQTTPYFHLEKLSNYTIPINLNGKQIFKTKTYITPILSYKTAKNSIIGNLILYNNNSVLLKLNIYLSNSLEKNSLPFYFKNFFFNIF
jgi:hypothetical protein